MTAYYMYFEILEWIGGKKNQFLDEILEWIGEKKLFFIAFITSSFVVVELSDMPCEQSKHETPEGNVFSILNHFRIGKLNYKWVISQICK